MFDAEVKREILRGAIEHSDFLNLNFKAGFRPLLRPHLAIDFDGVFHFEVKALDGVRRSHALRFARAISQNDKRGFPKHAQPVNPAPEAYVLMCGFGQRVDKRALLDSGNHSKPPNEFCWNPEYRIRGGAIQLPVR